MPIVSIFLGKVLDSRFQTRQHYDQASLDELAASIRANGLLQTPVGRLLDERGQPLPADAAWWSNPAKSAAVGTIKVELAVGHRRVRACRQLGLDEIQIDLRALDDDQMDMMAWAENQARASLNPIEEAEAIAARIERKGWTHQEAGDALGLTRSAVTNKLRLLELTPEIKGSVIDGTLPVGKARAVVTLLSIQAKYREAFDGIEAEFGDQWYMTMEGILGYALDESSSAATLSRFVTEFKEAVERRTEELERERQRIETPTVFDQPEADPEPLHYGSLGAEEVHVTQARVTVEIDGKERYFRTTLPVVAEFRAFNLLWYVAEHPTNREDHGDQIWLWPDGEFSVWSAAELCGASNMGAKSPEEAEGIFRKQAEILDDFDSAYLKMLKSFKKCEDLPPNVMIGSRSDLDAADRIGRVPAQDVDQAAAERVDDAAPEVSTETLDPTPDQVEPEPEPETAAASRPAWPTPVLPEVAATIPTLTKDRLMAFHRKYSTPIFDRDSTPMQGGYKKAEMVGHCNDLMQWWANAAAVEQLTDAQVDAFDRWMKDEHSRGRRGSSKGRHGELSWRGSYVYERAVSFDVEDHPMPGLSGLRRAGVRLALCWLYGWYLHVSKGGGEDDQDGGGDEPTRTEPPTPEAPQASLDLAEDQDQVEPPEAANQPEQVGSNVAESEEKETPDAHIERRLAGGETLPEIRQSIHFVRKARKEQLQSANDRGAGKEANALREELAYLGTLWQLVQNRLEGETKEDTGHPEPYWSLYDAMAEEGSTPEQILESATLNLDRLDESYAKTSSAKRLVRLRSDIKIQRGLKAAAEIKLFEANKSGEEA